MISFDELKDVERRQREADLEQLERFSIAAANGESVDSVQLLATLRVCGQSVDEFQKSVNTILERRKLKATADTIPAIKQRLMQTMAEIDNREKEFAQLVAAYSQRDNELKSVCVAIQAELSAADDARKQLRNSAPQWLHDQRREIDQERSRLMTDRTKLEDKIRNSESIVRSNAQVIEAAEANGRPEWELAENRAIANAEEQGLANMKERLTAMTEQLHAIDEQIATIDEQLLTVL